MIQCWTTWIDSPRNRNMNDGWNRRAKWAVKPILFLTRLFQLRWGAWTLLECRWTELTHAAHTTARPEGSTYCLSESHLFEVQIPANEFQFDALYDGLEWLHNVKKKKPSTKYVYVTDTCISICSVVISLIRYMCSANEWATRTKRGLIGTHSSLGSHSCNASLVSSGVEVF